MSGKKFNTKWLLPVTVLVSGISTGCGSKSKGDDAPAAPQPESVDTYIVESKVDGNKASIKIKSNIKDARFRCSITPENQPSGGTWSDCSGDGWQTDLAQGQRFIIKAKAVSPAGIEDQEPAQATVSAAAPNPADRQPGQAPISGQAPLAPPPVATPPLTTPPPAPSGDVGPKDLKTIILNKDTISSVVTTKDLEVNFALDGTPVDMSDVLFECKRESDLNYRKCPDRNQYKFEGLKHGGHYKLSVRATFLPTKFVAKAEEISFDVKLATNLDVDGSDVLESAKSGTKVLSLPTQVGKLMCSLDKETPKECKGQISINLDSLKVGSHQYVISAISGQEKTINFCAKTCSEADLGVEGNPNSTSGNTPHVDAPTAHQIGSFYVYEVQPGMHVTQYATTKTYNNTLEFYRIANDPYYVGNYNCNERFDRPTQFASPRGTVFDYCFSTPRRDEYKWLNEGRFANNHIEVAADPDIVAKSPSLQERILINVFDKDYEYTFNQSRFSALCADNLNSRGRISKSPLVPVIDDNFWGNKVRAEIFACWGQMPNEGPGIPTADQGGWWIGAFYISSNDAMPAVECFKNDWSYDLNHSYDSNLYGAVNPQFCQTYANPSMIEVIYATKKPFQQDFLFMQELQSKFRGILHELRPRQ